MTKKEASSVKKVAAAAKSKPRTFFSFSELKEREISLDIATVSRLDLEAKRASKRGVIISRDDLVANLIMEGASSLKFRPEKDEKKAVSFNIPSGLWDVLDEAAKRNKSTPEDAIRELIKLL
jgi:hypothetical protein